MKERGNPGSSPGIRIFPVIVVLILSITTVYGHINNTKNPGFTFSFSFDTLTSSAACSHPSDETITKFARYDHSDNEYDYYYLKLSMFPDKNERLIFYEEARGIEFYMTDKSEIFSDSALFYTRTKERDQFLSTLADFFYFARNEKQQEKRSLNTEDQGHTGYYMMAEPGGGGHGSPMTVSLTCDGAQVACSENTYSYPAGTTGTAPPAVNGYPNYGCLGSQPCPAWFYMQVGIAGDIIIFISQSNNHDVDFICWGPFQTLNGGCDTGLTGTCKHTGPPPPPVCCSNTQSNCFVFYPQGNMVDCSFSGAATETCHILNAQVGDIYILLITNFSQQPGTITFSQTGGSGWTNCNIVYHCSIISVTATPSTCNGGTNTFSVAGSIGFSNPPPTGTLTITDMTAIPQVSQTFFPPFTSPLVYNLSNIHCDGAVHTLVAGFSDSLTCTLNKVYTAPPEACPQAVISGGGSICSDGSTTANVIVTFTGTGPYDFTYAINGVPQTPVTGYNGPFPFILATNISGTYTLVSLSNPGCPGTGAVSGSAIVLTNPLPLPVITGKDTVCSGSSGNVYQTQTGMQNYQWALSAGGIITNGGGLSDYTCTVTWNSAGARTISVNYTDGNGCHAASPSMFNVHVNSKPVITNATNSTVCSGTILNIIPIASISGSTFSWTASGSSANVTGYFPGNGSSINDQLVNTGFSVETVTYYVTPHANNCPGDSVSYFITVEPQADAYFNPVSQALCTGQESNVMILSHAAGATYTWTATGSSGNVSGFSAGLGNMIQQILINSGFSTETVTYTVTPTVIGCAGSPANLLVTVNPKPSVTFTACWDPKTTSTGKPFRLKGGTPLGGTYSGTGVNAGIFTPSLAGPGTHTIHYAYTNTFGCSANASQTIVIINTPGFICGNTLTDIRDNKTYPTILINGQCWMAANLNYGTMINANSTQRDNCISEKYCFNNLVANCTSQQTYYQWDELMKYDETISRQGFCPPNWHIPSEAEWKLLFNNFISNGYAANPLKYSGFSGFNTFMSGTRHLDATWDYLGFATFLWSSTPQGTDKAWAHGMNDPDPSVSYYPAFKSNAFSVRCIKD